MNAVTQTFAIAFGAVIAAAALGVALADHAAQASAPPAQRAGAMAPDGQVQPVTRLPRVVVEHRRAAPVMAAANTGRSPAL